MNKFPDKEEKGFITGPAGQIEMVASSPSHGEREVTVIICHPHPQFEGTMDNKVVYTLMRTFLGLGFRAVKFNFRGVGHSEGEYGEAEGEQADLRAVARWVKIHRPQDEIYLAGFSFGSYIAASQANDIGAKHLVSIAPPVHHFDFDEISAPNCPWLVVQGDADEVVPPEEVFDWLDTTAFEIEVVKMAGVGHFFHGKLTDLRHAVEAHFRT